MTITTSSRSTKTIKILDSHMVTTVEVQGLMLVVPQDSTVKEAQGLMVAEEGLTVLVVAEVKDLVV